VGRRAQKRAHPRRKGSKRKMLNLKINSDFVNPYENDVYLKGFYRIPELFSFVITNI
jgi:hypothetical protein